MVHHASALISTLFFGGYSLLPGMAQIVQLISGYFGFGEVGFTNVTALFQFISLCSKVAFFMFLFVWIRWTLPRFRFDQLMHLGWKSLIPISLINLLITGLVVAFKEGWFN